MSSREPVYSGPIYDTEELIDHLTAILKHNLSNEVANVFYGDLGVYLPTQFLGERKRPKAILAMSPAYDTVISRTAKSDKRAIGVEIIGLVNITPFFKAAPTEAYGERELSKLMKKIRTILMQNSQAQLDGRVQFFSVNDIEWHWMLRKDVAIRAAVLHVEATVDVPRDLPL